MTGPRPADVVIDTNCVLDLWLFDDPAMDTLKQAIHAGAVRWGVVAAVILLQACATVANPDPRDPMEGWNRSVFGFNDAVDRAVVKPVATAYRDVLPNWMRTGIGNFFNNLEDLWSGVNNALQSIAISSARFSNTGDGTIYFKVDANSNKAVAAVVTIDKR